MITNQLDDFAHAKIFMVGIKGTGMSALAEILSSFGATIAGSDTKDTFYTDALLHSLDIPIYSLDNSEITQGQYDCVIYSPAYSPNRQKQLRNFRARDIPILSYPQMLGLLAKNTFSVAIAGVHGKTTITGMSATIIQALALAGLCIVGGQIHSLNNRSTYFKGNDFMLAETCEYQRHFLHVHPDILLVANIELDHQDYYADHSDMLFAFCEFAQQLRPDGALIYCHDDSGASDLAERVGMVRSDIQLIPYGISATGDFRITNQTSLKSGTEFSIQRWREERIRIQLWGKHAVLNAVAAIAAVDTLEKLRYNRSLECQPALPALSSYSGAKRRMETVGVISGITIIDDYAHHPTAIKATLEALKDSGRYRRIIVDFMSHTYSRTLSLLDEFTTSFANADIVITHRIYPSARERNKKQKKITGKRFATALMKQHGSVFYFPYPLQAVRFCLKTLTSGDIFITLGAGDNWKLGQAVHRVLQTESQQADSA